MGKNGDGEVVVAPLCLRPMVDWDETAPHEAAMAAMHQTAHDQCLIANSVLTSVLIDPQA